MRGRRIHSPARIVIVAAVFAVPLAVGLVEVVRGAWPVAESGGAAGSGGFIWMMLLAALHRLGCDPITLPRCLSVVSWMGVLAVLVVHAVRAPVGPWSPAAATWRPPDAHRDPVLMLPVAAWGVALHRDAQIQAAAGQDVWFLALLFTGGLLLLVNHPRRIGLAAAVYALSALLRFEGLLLSGTALAYVLWRHGRQSAGRFLAVWGALVAPYFIWSLLEDGRTIWSAGLAEPEGSGSWRRGWAYTAGYLRVYAVLPLGALGALAGWIGATAGRHARDPRLDVVLVALVQVLLALAAVVAAGGDVVARRACIPMTPLLYLVAEEVVRVTGRRFAVVGLAVLALGMTLGARFSR